LVGLFCVVVALINSGVANAQYGAQGSGMYWYGTENVPVLSIDEVTAWGAWTTDPNLSFKYDLELEAEAFFVVGLPPLPLETYYYWTPGFNVNLEWNDFSLETPDGNGFGHKTFATDYSSPFSGSFLQLNGEGEFKKLHIQWSLYETRKFKYNGEWVTWHEHKLMSEDDQWVFHADE